MSPAALDSDDIRTAALQALDRLVPEGTALGIALSGGGDSAALLQLAAIWAKPRGIRLAAATVDHGLRPESGQEAICAGETCAHLGIPHHILTWHDHPASGNLLEAAREARHKLLSQWARAHDLGAIATGHTEDDLAETLLMRLRRGSGLDGLAAMAEASIIEGCLWLRPLLACSRQGLREWLEARNLDWIDDPSNTNPRYERARIRAAMQTLGLDAAAIARSARLLADARDALNAAALALVQDATAQNMVLSVGLHPLLTAPAELRRRVLLAAIAWVAGGGHPPRQSGVEAALAALYAGKRTNLSGVTMTPKKDRLIFMREPAFAQRAAPPDANGIWDRRFRIAPIGPKFRIAAMPDGSIPAIWDGGHCLGPASAAPIRGLEHLFDSLAATRSQ